MIFPGLSWSDLIPLSGDLTTRGRGGAPHSPNLDLRMCLGDVQSRECTMQSRRAPKLAPEKAPLGRVTSRVGEGRTRGEERQRRRAEQRRASEEAKAEKESREESRETQQHEADARGRIPPDGQLPLQEQTMDRQPGEAQRSWSTWRGPCQTVATCLPVSRMWEGGLEGNASATPTKTLSEMATEDTQIPTHTCMDTNMCAYIWT